MIHVLVKKEQKEGHCHGFSNYRRQLKSFLFHLEILVGSLLFILFSCCSMKTAQLDAQLLIRTVVFYMFLAFTEIDWIRSAFHFPHCWMLNSAWGCLLGFLPCSMTTNFKRNCDFHGYSFSLLCVMLSLLTTPAVNELMHKASSVLVFRYTQWIILTLILSLQLSI